MIKGRCAGRGWQVALALAAACLLMLAGPAEHTRAEGGGTFGKTTIGRSAASMAANQKQVNRYALATPAPVTKLSIYLEPAGSSGQQVMKGVIYSDASGSPASLLGVSAQLTFTSASAAGWYDLTFTTPVTLAAGNYWIGVLSGTTAKVARFRFAKLTGSRDHNSNKYKAGPSNPFGSVNADAKQLSLYATYAPQPPPINTSP